MPAYARRDVHAGASLSMLQGESAQLEAIARDAAGRVVPTAPAATLEDLERDHGLRQQHRTEVHNVIFETKPGAPADIQESSRVTVSRVFGTLGLFKYECRIHSGMIGEVEVVP